MKMKNFEETNLFWKEKKILKELDEDARQSSVIPGLTDAAMLGAGAASIPYIAKKGYEELSGLVNSVISKPSVKGVSNPKSLNDIELEMKKIDDMVNNINNINNIRKKTNNYSETGRGNLPPDNQIMGQNEYLKKGFDIKINFNF